MNTNEISRERITRAVAVATTLVLAVIGNASIEDDQQRQSAPMATFLILCLIVNAFVILDGRQPPIFTFMQVIALPTFFTGIWEPQNPATWFDIYGLTILGITLLALWGTDEPTHNSATSTLRACGFRPPVTSQISVKIAVDISDSRF